MARPRDFCASDAGVNETCPPARARGMRRWRTGRRRARRVPSAAGRLRAGVVPGRLPGGRRASGGTGPASATSVSLWVVGPASRSRGCRRDPALTRPRSLDQRLSERQRSVCGADRRLPERARIIISSRSDAGAGKRLLPVNCSPHLGEVVWSGRPGPDRRPSALQAEGAADPCTPTGHLSRGAPTPVPEVPRTSTGIRSSASRWMTYCPRGAGCRSRSASAALPEDRVGHAPGAPGIQLVPASGTLAMAAASRVSAARSSGSMLCTLDLPQARAIAVSSMVMARR